MYSKVLLNNVKQYKRREISVEASSQNKAADKYVKLPTISNGNSQAVLPKYVKSRCTALEEIPVGKKEHSRKQSMEILKPLKPVIKDPKEQARNNLVADYGEFIHCYL